MKDSGLLFSIVIPLYNKGKYIADTMASVLSQTYADFEVIVVDDGSTDNGADIVKSIPDERVMYCRKANGGVSSARNYGVARACGSWIYFLDADDIMAPNALEVFSRAIASSAGKPDIVAGSYYFTPSKGKGQTFQGKGAGMAKNNYKWLFMHKLYIRAGSCIVRRELLQAYPYDESLSRFEDTEQTLRMLEGREKRVYVVPDMVLEHRQTNDSLSKASSDKGKDFTFRMNFRGKPFWAKCEMGKLLVFAPLTYPEERWRLLRQYKLNVVYAAIAKATIALSRRKWERLLPRRYRCH